MHFKRQRLEVCVKLCVFVFPVLIPTVAHASTIAVLGLARGPIGADLAVGPTVVNVGEGAIVAHPCLTGADTSAIGYVHFLPLYIYACASLIPKFS